MHNVVYALTHAVKSDGTLVSHMSMKGSGLPQCTLCGLQACLSLTFMMQQGQEELSASKAVVKEGKESDKGKKPKVIKQDGGTIYIGFEKE